MAKTMPSRYVMVGAHGHIWGHASTREEAIHEGLTWVKEWLNEQIAFGDAPSVGALYVIGATERLTEKVDREGGMTPFVLHDSLGIVGSPTPERLATLRPGAWADLPEYGEE